MKMVLDKLNVNMMMIWSVTVQQWRLMILVRMDLSLVQSAYTGHNQHHYYSLDKDLVGWSHRGTTTGLGPSQIIHRFETIGEIKSEG